ncbi:alpha/beta hydrolase [Actinoplanes sp. NBRC 103695]|uniref:alpha/beta hydrolase n=1 Tax=Actinoplanes sp. NBRC 103695 TaxID=3032202 RepID=UPI0024A355F0|nr:alpha/beta hydrolase [Actinoplanes sp. NBRC 103695]GLY93101.1 hypothetical protein Acsp02_03570 [Actinoplanes sp. NBRC 103695]
MSEALVIPGGALGPAAGMLLYAGEVAERRGATVHWHWWSGPPPKHTSPSAEPWVCDEIEPLLGEGTLLIGKSLGTNAAGLAASRNLPAVWLTPILTAPWVVAALERATAPMMLVGGTSDPVWEGEVAHRLSPHVLEVPGAGHGLQVPGPAADSVAVLARVVAAMDDFLDAIGWPDDGKAGC